MQFFKKPLAIVDVETTGLSPTHDRIIEISIIRVENGKIVDTLNTLINPQTYISPFIESMTGIKKEDIEEAPLFLEMQEKILELLEGAIFIAHNVNFDYSFIREELRRIEASFTAKTLCTARLSRRLYPQHRSHNLTALIERFNFECEHRHRAYDDAHVLYQFLLHTSLFFPKELFANAVEATMKNFFSADKTLRQNVEDLPETPGVYIFYDKDNIPLYVGKSTNIKDRVKSHLTPTVSTFREFSIMKNLSRIEYIKTAGELGALLAESEKVKELQPLFNRKLRLKKKFIALVKSETPEGYSTLSTQIIENFADIPFENLFGVFKSKKSVRQTLALIATEHRLCPVVLGIESGRGACFEFKLGRCKGACMGKEPAVTYNNRFLIAYGENKQFRPWMYEGPVEIIEKNEREGMFESFLVDKWCLLGKRVNEYEYNFDTQVPFDLDSYKIMSSYLKFKKANIRPVSKDVLQPYS